MTSSDFVPLEKRRQGLTIRTYKVDAAGETYDDSGTATVDPDDVRAQDLHPSARWPTCGCGRGGH